MKKAGLIFGWLLLVLGVLALLLSGLKWFAFYTAMDAATAFYHRTRQQALLLLGAGIAAAASGSICILLSRKRKKK